MLYYISILFTKEIFWKGGLPMNNADLVWRLVELLLQKDKVALDQAKNDNKPNDQKQDEA